MVYFIILNYLPGTQFLLFTDMDFRGQRDRSILENRCSDDDRGLHTTITILILIIAKYKYD